MITDYQLQIIQFGDNSDGENPTDIDCSFGMKGFAMENREQMICAYAALRFS